MAFQPPRTRAEEILRSRGLTQSEVARRVGWHTSHISRIMVGKVDLSVATRRALVNVLQCTEAQLYEPMGSPIPPPVLARPIIPPTSYEGFHRRLRVILRLLGVEDVDQLLLYLVQDDFSGLPESLARRIREDLAAETDKP